MFEHPRQLARNRSEPANGNSKFAVVDRTSPRGSARNVKEGLLGIKSHKNVVAWSATQRAREVVIVRLQRGQHLFAKGFGALFALIVQGEVTALALRKV